MNDDALKKTLVKLLSPLVRYLIQRGWGFVAVRDLLKAIYAAEAEKLLREDTGQIPNDSQISLVTAIHRKEVKRLRESDELADGAPDSFQGAHAAARVIATWQSSPKFCDENGEPRLLSIGVSAKENEFDDLVRATKADVRSRSILDELLRVGAVEVTADDKLRLLRNAYIGADPKEKLMFLAANVGDHLRSALHNLMSTEAPWIERALYHDSIPLDHLAAVRPDLQKLAEKFLKDANRHLIDANTVSTEGDTSTRKRMRMGVYYFEADSDDEK